MPNQIVQNRLLRMGIRMRSDFADANIQKSILRLRNELDYHKI